MAVMDAKDIAMGSPKSNFYYRVPSYMPFFGAQQPSLLAFTVSFSFTALSGAVCVVYTLLALNRVYVSYQGNMSSM